MKIFIRREDGVFSRSELLRFVKGGLRGPWYTAFRSRGKVAACRALRIMDVSGRRSEYHWLVEVAPAKAAWLLIQKLNGRRIRGKPVQVRRWFDRSKAGDRRDVGDFYPSSADRERRAGADRRRLVRVQFLYEPPAAVLG